MSLSQNIQSLSCSQHLGTLLYMIRVHGAVSGCEIKEVDWEEKRRQYGFQKLVKDFGEAVEDADFVGLHIPSNTSTRHFINHERLNMMTKRSWLINTSRGEIVDESALFDALNEH